MRIALHAIVLLLGIAWGSVTRYVDVVGTADVNCGQSLASPCNSIAAALQSLQPYTSAEVILVSPNTFTACNLVVPPSTSLVISIDPMVPFYTTVLQCANSAAGPMFTIGFNSTLEVRGFAVDFRARAFASMEALAKLNVQQCALKSLAQQPLIILPENSEVGRIFLSDSFFSGFGSILFSSNPLISLQEEIFVSGCVFESFSGIIFPLIRNQMANISNSTFRNSNSSAVFLSNARVANLNNCSFLNLTAGSLVLKTGNITAENCVFSLSSTPQVTITSSSVGLDVLNVLFLSSVFSLNSGSGLIAVLNPGTQQKIIFEDSWFANNRANPGTSASIIFASVPRYSEFRRCTFIGNDSNSMLFRFDLITEPFTFKFVQSFVYGTPFAVFKSNIHSNSSIELSDNTFSDIIVRNSDCVFSFISLSFSVQVSDSFFLNIISGMGPETSYSTISVIGAKQVTFTNCTFRNISGYRLSAIAVFNSNFSLLFSRLESIKSIHDCSGIYAINSGINVLLSQFYFLEARAGVIIYAEYKCSVALSNSLFKNYISFETLGAVYGGPDSVLNIQNVTFANGRSIRGAIIIRTTSSFLYVSNVLIQNCSGNGQTLIFWYSFPQVINNLTILDSNTTHSIIYCIETSLDLSNLVVQNVKAGSGIFFAGTSALSISNSYFYRNLITSPKFPGQIYIQIALQVFLSNSTFIENFSPSAGAICIESANDFYILNSTFLKNSAYKGAVFHLRSSKPQRLFIQNSQFLFNRAFLKNEGALDCYSTFGAGGVFHYDMLYPESLNDSIRNCTFLGNYAEFFGGILSFIESSTTLSLDFFSKLFNNSYDNRAQYYGNVVGSLWKNASANLRSNVIFMHESLEFDVRFVDQFDQLASGFQCPVQFQVIGSFPEEYFIPSLSYAFGEYNAINLTYTYASRFSFFRPIVPFPLINESVQVEIEVSLSDEAFLSYSFGPIIVRICEPGYVLISDPYFYYKCQPCSAGTFVEYMADFFSCRFCSLGKFSESRATVCSDCQAGKIVNQINSASCIQCGKGSFSDAPGKSSCDLCESGRYLNESSATRCYDCPLGSVTIQDGSGSLFSCICPEGKFGIPWLYEGYQSFSTCKPCSSSKGIQCKENSSIPFVLPGYWREKNVEIAKICFPQSACKETGYSIKTSCADGYSGRLCGECISGEFYRSFGECRACSSREWLLTFISLFFLFIFVFLVYSIFHSRPISRLDSRIMLLWIQFFGVFSRLGSTFPRPLKETLQFFSIFNLNVDLFSFCKFFYY